MHSRVPAIIVAHSFSVRVIAHSNPSQLLPLLTHVREVTGCDAGHQEVGKCSTRSESPEIENKGTSDPPPPKKRILNAQTTRSVYFI